MHNLELFKLTVCTTDYLFLLFPFVFVSYDHCGVSKFRFVLPFSGVVLF